MQADRLYYFSRSAHKLPGYGRNEFVNNASNYLELSQVPHWRQILSNFWVAPFEYNNIWWNSVEHMFQAYKINLADSAQAWPFTLNSGSVLGSAPGNLAQRNRKVVRLTSPQLQEWNQICFILHLKINLCKIQNWLVYCLILKMQNCGMGLLECLLPDNMN